MKSKASAWLTPRAAAEMIGWTDKNATERLTRMLRRAEKASGVKVLAIIPTEERTRLMVTMKGLRAALPELFVSSFEHLPPAINERFAETDERVAVLASRSGAHGSQIRALTMRFTALEALAKKIERGELRLVKGGLKG